MARMGTCLRHSFMPSPRLRGRARRSSKVSCQPASFAKAGSAGSKAKVVTLPTVSARARSSEVPARARAAPTTRLRSSAATPHAGIRLNEHIEADGPTVFAHACKMGLEGIVSKRKASSYRSGRSPDWLKSKNPSCPAVRREAEEDWGERTR
jgi:hypothetical protein